MAIEDYYVNTITIERSTTSQDAAGMPIRTYSTHLVLSGLLNLNASSKPIIADQPQIKATHKLFIPASTDINKTTDRVLDSEGNIYRIVTEPQDSVHRGHHFLIYLERIETDGQV